MIAKTFKDKCKWWIQNLNCNYISLFSFCSGWADNEAARQYKASQGNNFVIMKPSNLQSSKQMHLICTACLYLPYSWLFMQDSVMSWSSHVESIALLGTIKHWRNSVCNLLAGHPPWPAVIEQHHWHFLLLKPNLSVHQTRDLCVHVQFWSVELAGMTKRYGLLETFAKQCSE